MMCRPRSEATGQSCSSVRYERCAPSEPRGRTWSAAPVHVEGGIVVVEKPLALVAAEHDGKVWIGLAETLLQLVQTFLDALFLPRERLHIDVLRDPRVGGRQ